MHLQKKNIVTDYAIQRLDDWLVRARGFKRYSVYRKVVRQFFARGNSYYFFLVRPENRIATETLTENQLDMAQAQIELIKDKVNANKYLRPRDKK